MSNTKELVSDLKNQTASVKNLIGDLKNQIAGIDRDLEKALQHRERIASAPIPKAEVLANLFSAIDTSAENFAKQLEYIAGGCARKRKGTGVQKTPEVIRELGNYAQLNIDSINFFFSEELKSKLKRYIAEMDWPGGEDGLAEVDFKRQLAEADMAVDRVKKQRDELLDELRSIGITDFV